MSTYSPTGAFIAMGETRRRHESEHAVSENPPETAFRTCCHALRATCLQSAYRTAPPAARDYASIPLKIRPRHAALRKVFFTQPESRWRDMHCTTMHPAPRIHTNPGGGVSST